MTDSLADTLDIAIPAIRVRQPIGEFYVAVMSASDLRHVAYHDWRRIKDRQIETYTGIQRPLNPARVREIQSYIETVDATFPNSIIVTIPSNKIREPTAGQLLIRRDQSAAKLIDGQHRLAGFTDVNSEGFQLIVAIFVDLDLEDQAAIFSTINLKQTKVSRSLVYDLFEMETTRSPQKTAHDIAKTMNRDEQSPFYRRIKILGVVPKDDGEPLYQPILTQGTFVTRLLSLISSNPEKDRDCLKRGKPEELALPEAAGELVFRQFFVEDKDWAILKIMTNYFAAVRDAFVTEWNDRNCPLARTIGYSALMSLLPDLFLLGKSGKNLTKDHFDSVFRDAKDRARAESIVFSFERFPASGKGESELYGELKRLCTSSHS